MKKRGCQRENPAEAISQHLDAETPLGEEESSLTSTASHAEYHWNVWKPAIPPNLQP
jgi:hypothetical protein